MLGWAISYATRSYYLAAQTGRKPVAPNEISSPSFVFNQTTRAPNTQGVLCGGASMVDALGVLVSEGSTSLAHYPYTPATCVPEPTAQDKAAAGAWKIPGFETITASNLKVVDSYKEKLERGMPIIIGVAINTSEWFNFHGSGVYTLGPDSLNPGGKHAGHALVVVGYDDNMVAANGEQGAFRIQNSWGLGWGDRGYMWMSYKAFTALVQEAYVLKGVTPPMIPRDGVDAPAAATPVAYVTTPAATQTPTPAPPPPPANVPLPDLTSNLNALAATFKTGEVKVTRTGDQYPPHRLWLRRRSGLFACPRRRLWRPCLGDHGRNSVAGL
ncbi:MAG: C1 family peptidase [Asticcacaulis sp.]